MRGLLATAALLLSGCSLLVSPELSGGIDGGGNQAIDAGTDGLETTISDFCAPYVCDESTLALYHFNEPDDVNGACERGTWNDGQRSMFGVFDDSLNIDAVNSWPEAFSFTEVPAGLSAETWIYPLDGMSGDGTILTLVGPTCEVALQHGAGVTATARNSSNQTASLSAGAGVEEWTHVAMVVTATALHLSTAGEMESVLLPSGCSTSTGTWTFTIGGGFENHIDELRLSKVGRSFNLTDCAPQPPM